MTVFNYEKHYDERKSLDGMEINVHTILDTYKQQVHTSIHVLKPLSLSTDSSCAVSCSAHTCVADILSQKRMDKIKVSS